MLAVTTPQRVASLPETPTVSDFVPGYDVTGGLGFGATDGTPVEIVGALNRTVDAGLADDARGRLVDLGNIPMPMSPGDYGKLIADETEKWGRVIKFAGIKLT